MHKRLSYISLYCFLFGVCIISAFKSVNADEFTEIKKAAQGQTVYFNAWGGDTKINRYISWLKKTFQLS